MKNVSSSAAFKLNLLIKDLNIVHLASCMYSNKLTQKNTLKKKSKYLTQQLTSL